MTVLFKTVVYEENGQKCFTIELRKFTLLFMILQVYFLLKFSNMIWVKIETQIGNILMIFVNYIR